MLIDKLGLVRYIRNISSDDKGTTNHPDKTQRLGSFEQTSFVPFYGMCNVRPSWRTIVLIYALVYLTLHAALMQLLTEKNLITIKYIMNVSIY